MGSHLDYLGQRERLAVAGSEQRALREAEAAEPNTPAQIAREIAPSRLRGGRKTEREAERGEGVGKGALLGWKASVLENEQVEIWLERECVSCE